ncbi:MAG: single-stranded-DNA-specific exonuclease RecJ, partial [Aquificae bacterium]|nr:single-stranded-DNA-specific exonuclease RecJ [Aquificota bacterium]
MRGVTNRRWRLLYKERSVPPELEKVYGHLIARLLVNRGVERYAEAFLNPSLKNLPSPDCIDGLTSALERILDAVKKQKRIIVYGDYDVDGISATSILYKTLKKLGAKVYPVLPDRRTGYGLSLQLMSVFEKYGELLITVDNGTSAVREIDSSNLPTIVIDHHNVPTQTPKKAILVNPKAGAKEEALKALSSSALSYFLAKMLIQETNAEQDPDEFLDLVALGTLADYMPINLVNRILTVSGLEMLTKVARGELRKPGVRELLKSALGEDDEITSRDIYFSVAPRLNSAGRISKPRIALKLLLEEDEKVAKSLAEQLEELNKRRKRLTRQTYKEALKKAQALEEDNFIVVWDENWHPGILGIVAGRLAGELGKPVAVFSKGKNRATGSIRSSDDVDVYSKVSKLSGMFVKWGGHDKAMGVTL